VSKTVFKVTSDDRSTKLVIEGSIDEHSGQELLPIVEKLKSPCIINLKSVTSINSLGAMAWLRFTAILNKIQTVTFEECAVDFVAQTNMIAGFLGSANVASIFGQYFCRSCFHDETKFFEVSSYFNDPEKLSTLATQTLTCIKCGDAMELSEDTLIFLSRQLEQRKTLKAS
jgi:anti-anti-sigma regulatory factor